MYDFKFEPKLVYSTNINHKLASDCWQMAFIPIRGDPESLFVLFKIVKVPNCSTLEYKLVYNLYKMKDGLSSKAQCLEKEKSYLLWDTYWEKLD